MDSQINCLIVDISVSTAAVAEEADISVRISVKDSNSSKVMGSTEAGINLVAGRKVKEIEVRFLLRKIWPKAYSGLLRSL